MKATDLLKKQHRQVEKLFKEVEKTEDPKQRRKLMDQIAADLKMHTQIGIDDCSTDLSLRGMPVFRGLIGPMPEGKGIVRYESPEVFESLTKEWGATAGGRRSRRRAATEGQV